MRVFAIHLFLLNDSISENTLDLTVILLLLSFLKKTVLVMGHCLNGIES